MDRQLPNLLYIHSDQHAQHVLDCYGDAHLRHTHLGALAARGVAFDNVYCDSPICVPSRMSMLTGRRPYENQVWANEHQLDSGTPTLAHALGAAGYRPVLIGRMHAVGPDQLHGYTQRLVGDHGPNQPGGPALDRGALEGTAGPERISLRLSGPGQSAYQVHDEDVMQEARAFLRTACQELQSGRRTMPFNLSLGFMLPHPPYVARREDYERFAERMDLPRKRTPFSDALHPFMQWWRSFTGSEAVTHEETLRARAAYWGLVYRVDQWVGELLRILEEHDQMDNTLVVYTSDHGDMLGEHGLWWKHVFYEESVKVPLIMSWPNRLPQGVRCGAVMSGIDVTASMLDLMGAPALPNSQARSIVPHLTNPQDHPWDNVAFSEYCSRMYAPEGGCYQRMIRRDQWKLIHYHGQPSQLFNLEEDPDELNDLASNPDCASVLQRLREELLADWDAEAIALRMEELESANGILQKWGRNTGVGDSIRWHLDPAMNYLDEPA